MRIRTTCLSQLIYLTVTLVSVIICQNAICAEPALSSTGELGLDAKRYYDMGYDAAKDDFIGIGPFAVGTITGITLPIATGVGVAIGYQAQKALGIVTGASTFGLWLWGGNELSKILPKPTAKPNANGSPYDGQAAFEQGYTQCIDAKRSATYGLGVILGIGVDIYILYQIFADFHGFS